MTIIHTDAYCAAFGQYLRKGTPIRLSLKETRPTTHYVWRTRRDERVRPEHRRNEGRIFAWADEPATGHPGEDFNCRCEAIPYVPGRTELAFQDFTTGLSSPYERWENHDFVWHFFTGRGRGVSLLEIGHLKEVAEHYAYSDGGEGAFRRLSDQIADEARENGVGSLWYPFEDTYQFEGVEFSHGKATVEGEFRGSVVEQGDMLIIKGDIRFVFRDVFTDPIALREFIAWLKERPNRLWRLLQSTGALAGVGNGPSRPVLQIDPNDVPDSFTDISDLGGTAFTVTGEWRSAFAAEVLKDGSCSIYTPQGRR